MNVANGRFKTETGCEVSVYPVDLDSGGGETLIVWRVEDGEIATMTMGDGNQISVRMASLKITDAEREQFIRALGGTP